MVIEVIAQLDILTLALGVLGIIGAFASLIASFAFLVSLFASPSVHAFRL